MKAFTICPNFIYPAAQSGIWINAATYKIYETILFLTLYLVLETVPKLLVKRTARQRLTKLG